MKKMLFMIVPALICGMLFISCGKTSEEMEVVVSMPVKEDTYSGTFTVKYFVAMPESWGSGSGKTTLVLQDGKFTCTGNPGFIPAGGSGTYSINDDKIVFVDENFWTADFDWNLILNGEYDFKFDGKRLKISANKNNVGYYEYVLEKQEEMISNCYQDAIIVSESEFEGAPDDPQMNIVNMEIMGNCLKIRFNSSGCSGNTWIEKLIAQEGIAKSNPPIRGVKLSLDNKELCKALIHKEISFNITSLQVEGTKKVQLNISGNSILYEY